MEEEYKLFIYYEHGAEWGLEFEECRSSGPVWSPLLDGGSSRRRRGRKEERPDRMGPFISTIPREEILGKESCSSSLLGQIRIFPNLCCCCSSLLMGFF